MKRLFIKQKEIMEITGWGRTKTWGICATIRATYEYPIHRNDIEVKHFSDFLEIKENDVQEAIEALYKSHKSNILPKSSENTAGIQSNQRDLQGNST